MRKVLLTNDDGIHSPAFILIKYTIVIVNYNLGA